MQRRLGFALALLVGIPAVIILTQDLQIYPEIWVPSRPYTAPSDPSEATDFYLYAEDGVRIHCRRWAPRGEPQTPLRVAIFSHGNGGNLSGISVVPRWLAGQGIATYVYDYRGYGRSWGWPSEKGLYRDADAVWKEAVRRDGATPAQSLSIGHSLGGGPASYLAEKYDFAVLLTAATFPSLPERARLHPLFGPLAPFLWAEYPVRERISRLRATCLIVTHSRDDRTMPIAFAAQLRAAYRGSRPAFLVEDEASGHDGIVARAPELAGPLLPACFVPGP